MTSIIHSSRRPGGPPIPDGLFEKRPAHARERYFRQAMALPRLGHTGLIVAPPDRHLVVASGCLRLTRDPERHSCRPSVDVLFESVAREVRSGAIACLLTGMGKDGALGTLAIRGAGGITLVQDEASSVVFGMPREAIQLGAAERVLPLQDFAPALKSLIAGEHDEAVQR